MVKQLFDFADSGDLACARRRRVRLLLPGPACLSGRFGCSDAGRLLDVQSPPVHRNFVNTILGGRFTGSLGARLRSSVTLITVIRIALGCSVHIACAIISSLPAAMVADFGLAPMA